VDNTFVIWPHGPEKLEGFLDHLDGLRRNIHFTMETEKVGHLPFLNIYIYSRPDSSLGNKVYRKPTHINIYLNPGSHQHPSNKQAVLATLVHRARALCGKESIHGEFEFLRTTFKENGYSRQQIQRAINPKVRTSKPENKPTSVALLPYFQTTYGCVSRMLARHNIKSVGLCLGRAPSSSVL
jgi:hypothetical protein